jgi:integrase/recombinase XerD
MKLKQVDGIPNFYINEKSGIYYTRKMVNGRLLDRSTGLRHQKAAFRRHIEIMRDLNDGKLGWNPKEVPTFEQWWHEYRASKVKADSTWERDEYTMAYWLPVLGKYRLNDLRLSIIQRHINKRRAMIADTTMMVEQNLLRAVLKAAVEDGLIESNPAEGIEEIAPKRRTDTLSLDDQMKLFAVMKPREVRYVTFLLGTGARREEVQSILPSRDIDWEAQMVTLTRKGGMEQTIPLLDPILRDVLAEQVLENGTNALWPQHPTFWWKVLKERARKAKIAHVHPHQLRHTFATRYLQGGGDIYILSKLLNHASVVTTERIYAHLVTPDLKKLSEHVNLGLAPREGKILPFKGDGRTDGRGIGRRAKR